MYTGRETNAPLLIVEKYPAAHVADQTIPAEPVFELRYSACSWGGRRDSRTIFLTYDFILCQGISLALSLFFFFLI